MMNNAVNAWWPLLFYSAADAPKFRKGMIAMICTCIATLGVTWLVWYLEKRERNLRRHIDEDPNDKEKIDEAPDPDDEKVVY